jgi:ABC-type Mn2+/Zn2+ transport system permease subunit
MTVLTVVVGAVATIAGISASFAWDIPSGAAIVAAASVIFAFSLAGTAFVRA